MREHEPALWKEEGRGPAGGQGYLKGGEQALAEGPEGKGHQTQPTSSQSATWGQCSHTSGTPATSF